MPRLDVDHRETAKHTARLRALASAIGSLPADHQKLVGELILLRQFGHLELRLRSIVLKVLCGTTYCDGTMPLLRHRSSNAANAETNVRSYGRTKPLSRVIWTTANDIRGNLQHLLAPADPFYTTLAAHEGLFDEMRRVRHHIAHYNADTRRKYRPVVAKYYGAYVRAVTPGTLLISRRHSPPLVETYLVAVQVMVKDLTRA
jgi:hypothetical protein